MGEAMMQTMWMLIVGFAIIYMVIAAVFRR
jgi:hypothetical protein